MWRYRAEKRKDSDFLLIAAGLMFLENSNCSNEKRLWVRPTLGQRNQNGIEKILDDLRKKDVGLKGELRSSFQNFLKISSEDFEDLVQLVGPSIHKKNTNYRNSVNVVERLAITLRFLATGNSYHSLMKQYKISKQAISIIIPETCEALIEGLKQYIKVPRNEEEWKAISEDFDKIWNFPLCVGAIDGRYIMKETPSFKTESHCYHKKPFKVVIFAVVDANYNFLYANVDCQAQMSEENIFESSAFRALLTHSQLTWPKKCNLPGGEKESPYVFLGSHPFPLSPWIMTPYAGDQEKGSMRSVFNYRLTRARRVVENVFGILAETFRVFRKPMLLQPDKVEKVTLACVHLHNFLRSKMPSRYHPPGSFDVEHTDSGTIENGIWRNDDQNLQSFLNFKHILQEESLEATMIRDEFAEYFISDRGQVSWQPKVELTKSFQKYE